jgi:hypothetical protein
MLYGGITFGFVSLTVTLIAVACSQFEKLRAALLDIRQEHVTAYSEQEDGQVDEAHRDMQDKLNACISQHQKIVA